MAVLRACFIISELEHWHCNPHLHSILTLIVSVITLIGTIFVVLSLGEIASIYPTAGGKKHRIFPALFFPRSPLFP